MKSINVLLAGLLFMVGNVCYGQTVIKSVPHTINASGTYTLSANLQYAGKNLAVPAVTINASNVTIDFGGHVLNCTNTAVGTKALSLPSSGGKQTNVTIENGTIANFTWGIYADGGPGGATFSGIVVQDMRFYAITGVHINGGAGCTIQRNLLMTTGGGSLIDLINSTGTIVVRDNLASGQPTFAVIFSNSASSGNYFDNNFAINGASGFFLEATDKYRFNITDLCSTPYSGGTALGGGSN
jgi:Periplasmic copper-binding protein (NosD)